MKIKKIILEFEDGTQEEVQDGIGCVKINDERTYKLYSNNSDLIIQEIRNILEIIK